MNYYVGKLITNFKETHNNISHLALLCLLVCCSSLLLSGQLAQGASPKQCQKMWKYPEDCTPPKCTYTIAWRYKEPEDAIEFAISSSYPDRWTGIIFSNEANVTQSDGIFAWIYENSYVMMDAYMPDFSKAISDDQQSITNISAQLRDGIASFRFTRKRDTQDEQDISFADNSPCPYLIFPVDGGTVNYQEKTIVSNEHLPFLSDRRICIKRCENDPQPPAPSSTSPRPQLPFPSPSRTTSTRRPQAATTPTSTSTARPQQQTSTSTTTTTQAPSSTSSKRPQQPTSNSTSATTTTTSSSTTQAPKTTSSTTTTTTTSKRPTTIYVHKIHEVAP